jgi:hypothetical protein
MVSADVDGNGKPEIVVDFGSAGLWMSDTAAWSKLSGAIAEYLIPGDFDGDAKDEILVDFGALGLWMWNEGAWTQMSAENPLPSSRTLDPD